MGALELDHLATAEAYQVLMFFPRLCFIMAAIGGQAEFFDQSQFSEQIEGAIDGGETEARVPLFCPQVDLIRIEMAFMLLDDLQDEPPLRGDPLTLGSEETYGI